MRIGDAGGDCLGEGTRTHELDEVPRRLGVIVRCWYMRAMRDQPSLNGLVDDEVHDGLTDAEVRGDDALVEAHYSLQRNEGWYYVIFLIGGR